MSWIFLINSLICLGLCIFLCIRFFKLKQDKNLIKVLFYFLFIGLIYLFESVISFLWSFNFLDYNGSDFLSILTLIIVIQSFLLFKIVEIISQNKNLRYFLVFYFVTLLSIFYSFVNFLHFIAIISFLLTFLFFIALTFRSDKYSLMGYFGMGYSLVGIVLQVCALFGLGNLYTLSVILNLIFFIFMYIFIRDLGKYSFSLDSSLGETPRPYFLVVLGHLFFVIIFINFVFIGTIGIHEFGHFSVSKFYDCEYNKIVYENDFFHTEALCSNSTDKQFVLYGGIVLPLIIAIILFFIGGHFMKEIAVLMTGFNMISLIRDFEDLGFSNNLILTCLFFGAVLIILGIILIAKLRIEEEIYVPVVKQSFN